MSNRRFESGRDTMLAVLGKVMVVSERSDVTPSTGVPVEPSAEKSWTKIEALLGPPALVEIARVS